MGLLLLMTLPWILPKSMLSRVLSVVPLLAIAAMVYAGEDLPKDSVHITVLNPKDFSYAASLIQHKEQAWLLLSSYEKQYKTVNESMSLKQQTKLSTQLYDQLKKQNVQQLTGVIVQTATTDLAPVVANLNQSLPISYYWQAGLSAHKLSIDKALVQSSLRAQSCQATMHWPQPLAVSQQGAKKDFDQLSLKVLTGWEQVKDSGVWDCAIQLSSSQAVYLSEQGQTERLLAAIAPKARAHLEGVENDLQDYSQLNKVVIYSSSKPKLAQLWELMCDSSTQPHINHFNSSDKSGYWLTPSQSVVEKSMIDNFLPQQWKIIGENQASATLPLKESYLYWQQPPSD